jgi:hypothetical protein
MASYTPMMRLHLQSFMAPVEELVQASKWSDRQLSNSAAHLGRVSMQIPIENSREKLPALYGLYPLLNRNQFHPEVGAEPTAPTRWQ